MPYKDAKREQSRTQGTYDVYIEIDCDCEELLDAVGLDYKQCEDDDTQNEVCLSLDTDEYDEFSFAIDFNTTDEQGIASYLLNHELGEYTTKVTIYKPSGDVVMFK